MTRYSEDFCVDHAKMMEAEVVEEHLDTHVFTEDEDPSDRDDRIIMQLRIEVYRREDVAALKAMAEAKRAFGLDTVNQ